MHNDLFFSILNLNIHIIYTILNKLKFFEFLNFKSFKYLNDFKIKIFRYSLNSFHISIILM